MIHTLMALHKVKSACKWTQVSPETPVWHHCLSCPQCAVYSLCVQCALCSIQGHESSSSGEESVGADARQCPQPVSQPQGPPSQTAAATTGACLAMQGSHADPPLFPAADTRRPVRKAPPRGVPRDEQEAEGVEDSPDNPATGCPTGGRDDDGQPAAGPRDEPGSPPQPRPNGEDAPGAITAHQRALPAVEGRLFGTPQPQPYNDPPARPSTPPGPTAPRPGSSAEAEGGTTMAIDTETAAPQTTAEDPDAPPDAPQPQDHSQPPPRTSPQQFPATPVTPARSAASPPGRSPNSTPPDTIQPPHPAKRPHAPTGVTPAPQRKARPPKPPTPIRTPPTVRDDADGDARPQHDHASFWGYDLLAPRKGSRYLLWRPGPVPLPQVDPATACARFGTIAAHDAAGSPSHVAQRAPLQHYPIPAQRPGDASDEPGVGPGTVDHDH